VQVSYKGPEDEVGLFGLVFKRGVAVDVSDPHAMAKLRAHREFDVISNEQKPVETPTEAEAPNEYDALRETAAHLGIKVDGRWSIKKLQRVIAEAQSDE
jgi:hypothetical protein